MPGLSDEERKKEAVQKRFDTVAEQGTAGHFAYPTGEEGLVHLGYDPALTAALPAALRTMFCGTGNVQRVAALNKGDHVLDLGCGCGIDALLAALCVGPEGRVTALDSNTSMLGKARHALQAMRGRTSPPAMAPLLLCKADAHRLPLPDASVDCIISNGLFSLLPNKEAALAQCHRVLRSGGRLVLADQIKVNLAPLHALDRLTAQGQEESSDAGWAL